MSDYNYYYVWVLHNDIELILISNISFFEAKKFIENRLNDGNEYFINSIF